MWNDLLSCVVQILGLIKNSSVFAYTWFIQRAMQMNNVDENIDYIWRHPATSSHLIIHNLSE